MGNQTENENGQIQAQRQERGCKPTPPVAKQSARIAVARVSIGQRKSCTEGVWVAVRYVPKYTGFRSMRWREKNTKI